MLDGAQRRWLESLLGPQVRFDEPMAAHTSFRIGGPADALARPKDMAQLGDLCRWTAENGLATLTIGGGTNLLVADRGIRAVVISLDRMAGSIRWRIDGRQVIVDADAGMATKRLCALALRQGWSGLNFALGIPGSFGGAITMNAGTAHGNMAGVLTRVTALDTAGRSVTWPRQKLTAGYRTMAWPDQKQEKGRRGPIIVSGRLQLTLDRPERVRRQACHWMRTRVRQQPTWQPCAGCFFRNPAADQPAGQLIDQAGLKGLRRGDARISPRHANFIINTGRATAADVLALKRKIETEVWERFGIRLEPEVKIVGQETQA